MGSVSGYVITLPLGLWGELQFRFVVDSRGNIDRVQASHVDSEGEDYYVPSKLVPLADAYMATWLASQDGDVAGGGPYLPDEWIDLTFWQETTALRLEALVEDGQATFLEAEWA